MNAEGFKKLLKAQPFLPFKIVMSSGETYEVLHPEMAWVARNVVVVGRATHAGSAEIPEFEAICSLLHIASIEFHSTSARS